MVQLSQMPLSSLLLLPCLAHCLIRITPQVPHSPHAVFRHFYCCFPSASCGQGTRAQLGGDTRVPGRFGPRGLHRDGNSGMLFFPSQFASRQ